MVKDCWTYKEKIFKQGKIQWNPENGPLSWELSKRPIPSSHK